ncbi:MAG: NAD-dependent epimerase/dehydratase family protein [Thermoplasmatota archaeon]
MKYFVTGATGFIGGHLARRLAGDGHEVTALVRDPESADDLRKEGIHIHVGDITETDSMAEGMKGSDGVFHTAGWYKLGQRDSSMAERTNVRGTMNVFELMKDLGVRKGVYTSTLTVFSHSGGEIRDESFIYKGRHLSEYDHSKWKAHFDIVRPLILNQRLPIVIVMPGVAYGPGDNSFIGKGLDDLVSGKLPALPKETAFCWSHVDDIVDGHILAMEKGAAGETYIIGGPPHTLVEAMEIAGDIAGVKPPGIKLSPGIVRMMSNVNKVVNALVPLQGYYHPETLRVLAGTTYLGTSEKARKELGYNPRSLKEGLSDYLPKRMEELNVKKK